MIDKYFIMHQIRYSKISELLSDNKVDIRYGKCNLFINFETILMKMCNPSVDEYLRVAKDDNVHFMFASCILNLIAHYRAFFSKHGIQSKIYLYYQSPNNTHQMNHNYNPDYRRRYVSKFTDGASNYLLMDILLSSQSTVKLISEYIDGVYVIDPCGMESSLVPLAIVNNQDDNTYTNILISSSKYDFQYVNYGFNIIIPKGDKSTLITKSNMNNILTTERIANFTSIPTTIYPFILSIVGDPIRNIYGIKGVGLKRATNMIRGAIDADIISPSMDNINLLIQSIKEQHRQQVRTNYQCVNIASQYNDLSPGTIYQITEQLVDKFDNESLKRLNDEYFTWNPIRLIEITSIPKTKKNITF